MSENVYRRLIRSGAMARAIRIDVCKDGTISFCPRKQPPFNGVALPVYSVNTEEQAETIQVRFGRRQYIEHPEMPSKGWYKLSTLPNEPFFCRLLEVDDLPIISFMFDKFYQEHCK